MKRFVALFLAAVLICSCWQLAAMAYTCEPEQESYHVYELQYILKIFGYFSGECTGYYGDKTVEAVRAYQKDAGFSETGTADEDTVASLRAAACYDSVSVNVKSMLTVREEPSEDAEAVDYLTRSSYVMVFSKRDGWYHIETAYGAVGFVPEKYLTIESSVIVGLPGKIESGDAVNGRKTADISGEVVAKFSPGQSVWVIGGVGDWFKIDDGGGNVGYVFKQYVNIGGASTAATTINQLFSTAWKGSATASLKVRSGPGTGYDVLTTLSKGSTVSILGETDTWYFVELNNSKRGYCSKDYIQKGSGYKTCTIKTSGDALTVRKGPGETYEKVGVVKNGTVVTLLDDSAAWYKIKTSDGVQGYVSGSYVVLGGSLSSNGSGNVAAANAPSGTYKQGSQGSSVTTIQKRLITLGYLASGNATGYYGTATVNAVKSFQSNNGLTKNGTCDRKTIEKMFSSSAKKASTSSGKSSGGSSGKDTPSGGSSGGNSSLGQQIANYAAQFLGVPYVYGGNGPRSFDCTGFTKYVYAHFGITLLRSAYQQGYNGGGKKITSISALQVGDLVYFNTINDSDLSDHAGIYVGGGRFIHAPRTGSVVSYSDINNNYWRTHFSWGRRMI